MRKKLSNAPLKKDSSQTGKVKEAKFPENVLLLSLK